MTTVYHLVLDLETRGWNRVRVRIGVRVRLRVREGSLTRNTCMYCYSPHRYSRCQDRRSVDDTLLRRTPNVPEQRIAPLNNCVVPGNHSAAIVKKLVLWFCNMVYQRRLTLTFAMSANIVFGKAVHSPDSQVQFTTL